MEFYGSKFSSCIERCNQASVKEVSGKLVCAVLSGVFAVVGSVFGSITGGILGHQSMCGAFRGAVVGGVSGVVFSVEVFESIRRLWVIDGKPIQCLLYLIDVYGSLISGTLVQELVGPIMFNAVLNTAMIELSFNIFESGGGCKGLPPDIIHKIPKIKINSQGEPCSVCIEDFQVQELVLQLPYCHHMFHTACIDKWLMIHGSCPLCRRDVGAAHIW